MSKLGHYRAVVGSVIFARSPLCRGPVGVARAAEWSARAASPEASRLRKRSLRIFVEIPGRQHQRPGGVADLLLGAEIGQMLSERNPSGTAEPKA